MNDHHSNHYRSDQLEWLLKKRLPSKGQEDDLFEPYYGDVTELNTNRLILDSVGKNTLRQIAEDAIDLLETSVAIYESNGDYAFGMFSSGWCQLMDTASRKLCHTDDNRIALDCGCWLCHENCWNDSAKVAIESGQSTDIQCVGGINLYAEPIYAGKSVVGTINIGYGKPPTDLNCLKDLSDTFDIEIEKLKKQADSYNPRPLLLVDLAKKRLRTSANLIGEMVEKAILQKKLQDNKTFLESTNRMAKVGGWELDIKTQKVLWTHMTGRIHELPDDFVPTLDEAINYYHPDDQKKVTYYVSRAIEEGLPYEFEARLITAKGRQRWVRAIGESTMEEGQCVKLSGTFQDITDRKQTEKALLESEERLKLSTESGEIGLWELNLIDHTAWRSLRHDQIFGYETQLQEWTYEMFLEHVIEDDRSMVEQEFGNALENLELWDFKCRIKRTDGVERWIWAKGNPEVDINQKPIKMHGTVQDITDLKHVEESLHKSEFIFKQTFEQSSTSTCFYDPEGTIIYVNREFCKMFGVKEQEILNARYNLFNDQAAIEAGVIPVIRDLFENKKTKHWEIEFDIAKASASTGTPTSKAEKLYLEVFGYPVVNRENEMEFVVLKHYDITKRKQAEKTIISMERRNQALLDYSPVCHKIVDLDFNLQYMSASGFKMLKLDNNTDVYGKPYPFYFFSEPFKNAMIKKLKKVKKSGQANTIEALTNDIEGNEVWLDSSLIPVFDDTGKINYITVVSANATQRKLDEKLRHRLEERLIQAQKMEAIGTIAGGIAHDFNNILFPIIGMSELLLEDLSNDSLEYENVLEILTAGKRGADLVNQILAFSRQTEHKMSPTRIQTVLKEVLKLIRSTIPSYIEINQDIKYDCSMVMADPTQIHQIAMNILTNAYHATEKDGGKISVVLRETELDLSDLPSKNIEPGKYALLSFSDTGNGIPPEYKDKIFDPYFTTKNQGKGTGLGLAVVYGIVKEHKGDISVYSEIGKGTTFNIYLPLLQTTSIKDLENPIENLPTGNENILLIDDEEPIAKLEKLILERLGYCVTKQTNPIEALVCFKERQDFFDLIISDMNMPNMTGVQLAKEIKSIRNDIPFIICTGFSDKIGDKKADVLGIESILMKPVIKSEMAETVRNVLDVANG